MKQQRHYKYIKNGVMLQVCRDEKKSGSDACGGSVVQINLEFLLYSEIVILRSMYEIMFREIFLHAYLDILCGMA
jgi:hypothetical protein